MALQALCIAFSYRNMNILSLHQVGSAPGGNHKWCTFFNQFIIKVFTPLYIHLGCTLIINRYYRRVSTIIEDY
jgi:hypothetical protein